MPQRLFAIDYAPYRDLDYWTKDAFLDTGRTVAAFFGDAPKAWACRECGNNYDLDDICVADRPLSGIPVCPSETCNGIGWSTVRPAS